MMICTELRIGNDRRRFACTAYRGYMCTSYPRSPRKALGHSKAEGAVRDAYIPIRFHTLVCVGSLYRFQLVYMACRAVARLVIRGAASADCERVTKGVQGAFLHASSLGSISPVSKNPAVGSIEWSAATWADQYRRWRNYRKRVHRE